MSSIQPSSGAPMPPGAAVGPVEGGDAAMQSQVAALQEQLDQIDAQVGGRQATAYATEADPGFIGMQGTSLVESIERARMMESAATSIGGGDLGAPTPRLGDLIGQARIRRDIDQQMRELGPTLGGGGAASGALRAEAQPYMGGGSIQTGPYTGGASMQPATGQAMSEEQQLEQLMSQMTPAELAELDALMQAEAAGGGATGAVPSAPASPAGTAPIEAAPSGAPGMGRPQS